MNTPTPRTDERKASFALDTIRQLETELTAAQAEIAEWRILNGWGGTPEIINDFIKGQQTRIYHAQNLEEELTAACQEIDMLKSKYADHHAEAERLTSEINAVTEQRDEWANLWAELSRSCVKDYVKLERELISITEQRDRLAEAMTRIVNIYENPEKGCIPSSSDMYDEALQSLTTNASLSHGDGSATPLHEKS